MESKTCTLWNIEKDINNFYKKFSEGKGCNRARRLERFCDNKDKTSQQQKKYFEKKEKKYYCKSKTINVYNLET